MTEMERYAKLYKQKYCGRVSKIDDYRFFFEELDPKHSGEVKKSYWVMKSYFWNEKEKKCE